MSILNITFSDFGKGKFELHGGIYEQSKIQSYIDKFEKRYLLKLFGAELFGLFENDLTNGVPQTQRFLDVFNAFDYDDGCQIISSDGLIEMLKGFIYFEYVRDLTSQMTVNGNVRPVGENSEPIQNFETLLLTRYNDAVNNFQNIQKFMCDNSNNYREFNGGVVRTIYWS
jgi:hypothetical protein